MGDEPTELRVLVVEDDDVDWMALQRHARSVRSFTLNMHRAAGMDEGLAALGWGEWDVLLLDFRLAGPDALDFLAEMRGIEAPPDVPVIVLTGFDNADVDRAVMEAGASDYLPKDQLTGPTLDRSLRHTLDRHRLLSELRQREAGFRAVALNADGVVVVDDSGIIRFSNTAARVLLDIDPDDLAPSFPPALDPEAGEGELMTRSGTHRTVELRAAHGVWEGAGANVVSLRDVTVARKLERDLQQAAKMGVVGELAGGIAHDFNNILMAILGATELARLPAHREELSELLKEIELSARRAADLTARLLAFSRRSVGPARVVDLDELVADMQSLLARSADTREPLTFARAHQPVPVRVDPTELGQILMNLVANAAAATRDGGAVEVRTQRMDHARTPDCGCTGTGSLSEQGLARLSVTDTGCGIDPEILGSIFDPFFTTGLPGDGAGIGLSTVYGIVDAAGGHVCAASTQGVGSRFDVYLPLHPADDVDPVTDPHLRRVPPVVGSAKCLVVDDERPIRELLARRLADEGYSVSTAASGEDALALASDDRFDLLLTDIVMPGMDGLELAARLTDLQPDIKIALMAGYAAGIDPGQFELLAKPFRLAEALIVVRRLLGSDAPGG